jgi:hypothetical protein
MILLTFSLTFPMETASQLTAIWDVGIWDSSTSLSSWLVILLHPGLAPSRDFVIFLLLPSFWTWYLWLAGPVVIQSVSYYFWLGLAMNMLSLFVMHSRGLSSLGNLKMNLRLIKGPGKFFVGILGELTLRVNGMPSEAKLLNLIAILSVFKRLKENPLILFMSKTFAPLPWIVLSLYHLLGHLEAVSLLGMVQNL